MRIILLTSDYYLSANLAVKSFLSQKAVKNGEIEVVGILVGKNFSFDERSNKRLLK
jgi:hypothetical protein